MVRVEQEQTGTFQENIRLEDAALDTVDMDAGIALEDEQDFDDGENIILDGTGVSTPAGVLVKLVVKVVKNSSGANVFQIDGRQKPVLRLTEGNTYNFDLCTLP